MSFRFLIFSFVLTVAMLGCSDPAGPPRIEDVEFAPELEVDLDAMTKTASGLYVQELTIGTGEEVEANDFAHIYYTGWLVNGDEFDSTQPPEEALRVFVGVGGLIRGFAEGMLGMREGGKRRLVIPSRLAYGANPPSSQIPKNAILVFVVELVDVE